MNLPEFLPVAAEVAAKSLMLPAIAFAVLALLRRVPAVVRHRVPVTAFLLLALLPLLTAFQQTLPQIFPLLPSPSLAIPQLRGWEATFKDQAVPEPVKLPDASEFQHGERASPPPSTPVVSLPAVILALWGGGALVFLTTWVRGLWSAGRLAQTGEPVPTALQAAVSDAAAHLGIAPVATCIVPALAVPAVCGMRRPLLLLPAHASEWDTDRLRSVLLHELAHIARADFAIQTFARIISALYFWNPLVWLLFSRLRAEAETACDERVLAAGIPPTRYAAHLFAIAREAAVRPAPATIPAMVRAGRLESRIRAILTPPMPRPSRRPWLVLPVGIAAMVALFALRLHAAPEEPRVAVPTDAAAFLKWSMSQHAALRTYRSSSWIGFKGKDFGADLQRTYHRTIAYTGSDKFLVRYEQIEGGHGTPYLTATSGMTRYGKPGTAGYTVPTRQPFTNIQVYLPRTLFYRFFDQPSQYRNIVPSGDVRFAGDMQIRGEKCRTIRFTGPYLLGEVTAAIRLRDGMLMRLFSDRWYDPARGEDRRQIDDAVTFARQMLKKYQSKTDIDSQKARDYFEKKVTQLSALYHQTPSRIQVVEEVHLIETNRPIPDAALRDGP
jgi:beta-lactamase regulating signal transducer with metallopeptidase domain